MTRLIGSLIPPEGGGAGSAAPDEHRRRAGPSLLRDALNLLHPIFRLLGTQIRLHGRSRRLGRASRARSRRWREGRPGKPALVFANPYARLESVPELAPFAAHATHLVGERLRVVFVNGWTGPYDPDEERTVLQDLADGVADLAWVGARAVGAVFGIRSLEPLHAPLLFPDENTVRQFLLATPVQPLLEPLKEVGLEGLALLPGGLRRPFGITGPLLGAEDWQDKLIRTHSSLSGEATIRLLGATPVLRSVASLRPGPPSGVDGMDLHYPAIAAWRYSGWLTSNVPLWPRLLLLVANRRRLERLLASDRRAVREAARRSFVDAVTRPSQIQKELPDSVKLIMASDDQLALLRDRMRPLYDQLRSTTQGERTLDQIERHIAAPA